MLTLSFISNSQVVATVNGGLIDDEFILDNYPKITGPFAIRANCPDQNAVMLWPLCEYEGDRIVAKIPPGWTTKFGVFVLPNASIELDSALEIHTNVACASE